MFGRTCAGKKYCYDFVQEFSGLTRVLDHCPRNNSNEGVDDGIRDGMFDVRDVKVQGEGVPKQRRGDDIESK